MIQGGGYTKDMKHRQTDAAIENEATNGLKNVRGTLAMARTPAVNSATSQFFINLADNEFLDHKNTNPQGFGYAVFGNVVKGMDIVEKIGATKTGHFGPMADVPKDPIIIQKIKKI
jgi:cyclophilin family peptidyl-prolyl cis-trans isomerase